MSKLKPPKNWVVDSRVFFDRELYSYEGYFLYVLSLSIEDYETEIPMPSYVVHHYKDAYEFCYLINIKEYNMVCINLPESPTEEDLIELLATYPHIYKVEQRGS